MILKRSILILYIQAPELKFMLTYGYKLAIGQPASWGLLGGSGAT